LKSLCYDARSEKHQISQNNSLRKAQLKLYANCRKRGRARVPTFYSLKFAV